MRQFLRRLCILTSVVLLIATATIHTDKIVPPTPSLPSAPIQFNMPIVKTDLPPILGHPVPHAKRDASVRYYLQSSVRIKQNGVVKGSGTICYYDEQTGEAWVISAGHLWNGNKEPGSPPEEAEIELFYKNDKKLPHPKTFKAEIICYSNRKVDIAFLKFRPDWVPQHYFSIAPKDYLLKKGDVLESTGCDRAEIPASYTVTIIEGERVGPDLITQDNSPRPGRSGGGLLTTNGLLVGICWGTTEGDGSGYGYFVPLRKIHSYTSKHKEIAWLLKVPQYSYIINLIPIVESNGIQRQVIDRYIPVP